MVVPHLPPIQYKNALEIVKTHQLTWIFKLNKGGKISIKRENGEAQSKWEVKIPVKTILNGLMS